MHFYNNNGFCWDELSDDEIIQKGDRIAHDPIHLNLSVETETWLLSFAYWGVSVTVVKRGWANCTIIRQREPNQTTHTVDYDQVRRIQP